MNDHWTHPPMIYRYHKCQTNPQSKHYIRWKKRFWTKFHLRGWAVTLMIHSIVRFDLRVS